VSQPLRPAQPGPITLDPGVFAAALGQGQPLIGVDAGTKTLGLALSDTTRLIATGVKTIRRTKFGKDAAELLELAERSHAGGIVIGHPLNMDGSEGPRAQGTRAFARNLSRLTPLPILLFDERLSSVAAERALIEADVSRSRRREVIDKVAATIILQTALDALRRLR
jgi:putative Holliday junction resolvase